jgi:hypothetical protein
MAQSNGYFDEAVRLAAPYTIAGRTGVLLAGMTPGEPVARLVQLGMLVPPLDDTLRATPIKISQIRMRYSPTETPVTAARVFEIHKGTAATPATTGGTAHAAQRRKTGGYPAIALTETHLYVSTTDLISGGAFTALDSTGPIDTVHAGSLDGGEAIWQPSDMCPITLEVGEGLEVRIAQESASGSGILFVAFDFLR